MERIDGRPYNYLRKVKITPNYLAHPAGSVLIEMGGTKVVCSVTFEQGVPGWMRTQGVTGGWLTSEYGMLPASTHARNQREATRGKQSGRTMEIQRLIGRSFRSVIDLKALGTNTVYIDCDVIDADGGTRCASITGASVALQLAFRKLVAQKVLHHFPMRENVAAVSVGMKNGEVLLDLCYEEDSNADVDMNVIMTESGKIIEVQGTAEEVPFSRGELDNLLDTAQSGLQRLFGFQRAALGGGEPRKPREPQVPLGNIGAALESLNL